MAAIGKIRQHYGILVVIIGVALLAFVLGDLLNSKGGGRIDNEIAVVNGKKISREDWSRRVEAEKSRNGGKLSNEDEFNLKEGTLYVSETNEKTPLKMEIEGTIITVKFVDNDSSTGVSMLFELDSTEVS